MRGVLHVLQYAGAAAARLRPQLVEYDDPPQRGRRFAVRTPHSPAVWHTARVEFDPQPVTDTAVWFQTAHTPYLLEQAEEAAGGPEGLEDEGRE